ncbi:MAG: hypothetical protein IRZ33_05800 [Alicyclobacillaceae bacterium]|nr:hypothetical protein [Alicyclobacillaceae bacterium]
MDNRRIHVAGLAAGQAVRSQAPATVGAPTAAQVNPCMFYQIHLIPKKIRVADDAYAVPWPNHTHPAKEAVH